MSGLNKHVTEIEEAVHTHLNLLKLVANCDIKTNASEDGGEGLFGENGSFMDSMIDGVEMIPGIYKNDSYRIHSDNSDINDHFMISKLNRKRECSIIGGQIPFEFLAEFVKDLFKHFRIRKIRINNCIGRLIRFSDFNSV
jgi:hypothetical protein